MRGSAYRTGPVSGVKATGLAMAMSAVVLSGAVLGCSTKNYVRAQTAPIVQNVNELDEKTAADHRAIGDTDAKAQAGIAGAMTAANNADQHALAAGAAADQANASAQGAANRVDSLAGVVANLDQYKSLADVSVTFKFDKSSLTVEDKKELDGLAGSLASARGYILQVTGGADVTGDADYNYRLSQRRADAVVTYLSVKYNVAPHRFYLVGIGKDQQVAGGKAKNRRVDVQLLSNMSAAETASSK